MKKAHISVNDLAHTEYQSNGYLGESDFKQFQLQRCGSLKLRKPRSNLGWGMTTSKSFSNSGIHQYQTTPWSDADDVSNTLPRSGKQKSGEHVALFFDILSTQERFVQVCPKTNNIFCPDLIGCVFIC